MFTPKGPYKNFSLVFKVLVFLLFFLLFTLILSSGLFVSKLNLEKGQPSPVLITAPYDKSVEDLTSYSELQEQAASAVAPVYTADQTQISILSNKLDQTFQLLEHHRRSESALTDKLTELRDSEPFAALSDEVLANLLQLTDNEIEQANQISSRIIIGIAGDPTSGAKEDKELAALREGMKEQVEKYNMDDSLKSLVKAFIETNVNTPTLAVDEEETKKLKDIASSRVKPQIREYRKNEKIVGPGEIVDEQIYSVLEAYGLIQMNSPWKPAAGIAIEVLVAMVILISFFYFTAPEILEKWHRLVLLGLIMVITLAIGKAFLAINISDSTDLNNLTAILIPAAWATMTVTILLGARIAVVVGIILGIFAGTMADPATTGTSGSMAGLFALFSGLVGIQSVARLDQRSDLARAGLIVAVVNIALVSAITLILDFSPTFWLIGCGLALANGFLCSVLTMGTLPWLESGFNITSAVRLLELSNPNAPLLKELLMEAPGTYHHSVLVGNLAETAAEEIKADPVLVRVGALYHDIGKLKRPYFFIENQFAKDNPHDKIAPTLSSLILISHVKDGLELAREHKLPESIQDIIAQHHGDSLVSYFYHKAREDNPDIPEEAFRYDGLRPQSKEAALVLLADNVEAAVRSQKENTPGKIEGLVRKIIKEKLDEGLLDQCDLTFRDLDKISTAFVKVLSGIFHTRIEYPELPSKLKAVSEAITQEQEIEITETKQTEINEKKETNRETEDANIVQNDGQIVMELEDKNN
ncbi:MAG: HDIG domain-containing protein [Peptococcaceae bacterium]|nr:HDIG domain-containing protein [Peptococcaceae bacterium]